MLLNTLVKTIKRKSHRGDQSVTTDQITTDILACINEAMRECVRMIPKQFFWKQGTVPVTSGTQATPSVWSLPSDCQEPIAFWYVIGNAYFKIRKVASDQEWLGGVWDTSTSTGQPLYYREIGPDTNGYKQIEIFPIPNFSFTLNLEYYRTKTVDLTDAELDAELS